MKVAYRLWMPSQVAVEKLTLTKKTSQKQKHQVTKTSKPARQYSTGVLVITGEPRKVVFSHWKRKAMTNDAKKARPKDTAERNTNLGNQVFH